MLLNEKNKDSCVDYLNFLSLGLKRGSHRRNTVYFSIDVVFYKTFFQMR